MAWAKSGFYEDLSGYRIEERQRAVFEPDIERQNVESRGKRLIDVGSQGQRAADLVKSLGFETRTAGVH